MLCIKIDGKKVDFVMGSLDIVESWYQTLSINANRINAFLFEETCFLILFGYLPNKEELENFKRELSERYELPPHYLESKILVSI